MFKVEQLIPFLIKNKLTTAQFYLLYCVHYDLGSTMSLYKKEFPSDNNSMIGKSATDDLFERGFLKSIKIGEKIVENKGKQPIYKYIVTDKFLSIFIDKDNAIKDILKVYPNYYRSSNGLIFLKKVDFPAISELYWLAIDKSSIEHTEVIKDIEFCKKHNLIDCSLDIYIKEHRWKSVRESRYMEEPLEIWEEKNI